MQTLNKKDKRSGIRVPLLAEKIQYTFYDQSFEADIGDITNEGVFLKTQKLLVPKTPLEIHMSLPGDLGKLVVKGRVVRINWTVNRRKNKDHLGMGVQFEDVNPGAKKILEAYVVYLRNKQIISVSKKIIEEFFGSQGPKKIL
jgi:Tfp pilus assembly protein PilZ